MLLITLGLKLGVFLFFSYHICRSDVTAAMLVLETSAERRVGATPISGTIYALVAEQADAPSLNLGGLKGPWRFEFSRAHHLYNFIAL